MRNLHSWTWFSRFTCAVQLHPTALQTVVRTGSAMHVLAGYIRADCLITHDRRPAAICSVFDLQRPAADIVRVPHEPHSLVTCTNVNGLKKNMVNIFRWRTTTGLISTCARHRRTFQALLSGPQRRGALPQVI